MNEPIENTADAIIALYNASPRMPTRDQVVECLRRCAQMPDVRVTHEEGVTFYVSGDALSIITSSSLP